MRVLPAVEYSDLDENLDPVPSWRFAVTFPEIPGSSVSGETLAMLVQRVSIPLKAIEVEPVPYEGGIRHWPTGWSIEHITLVFAENVKFDVALAFQKWIDKVISKEGNFAVPKDYKRDFTLEPLGFDGRSLKKFKWKGCMPMRLDGYDWDGTQSAIVMPQVTMTVTDAPTIE